MLFDRCGSNFTHAQGYADRVDSGRLPLRPDATLKQKKLNSQRARDVVPEYCIRCGQKLLRSKCFGLKLRPGTGSGLRAQQQQWLRGGDAGTSQWLKGGGSRAKITPAACYKAPACRWYLALPQGAEAPSVNSVKDWRTSVQLFCISRCARRKCLVTSSLLNPSTAATSSSVYP